jgi:hypothetical protein
VFAWITGYFGMRMRHMLCASPNSLLHVVLPTLPMLFGCRDLVAYWQFEDTVEYDKKTGASKPRLVAKDSSRNGNDLPLVNPPTAADVIIQNDVRYLTCRTYPSLVTYAGCRAGKEACN